MTITVTKTQINLPNWVLQHTVPQS